MTRAWRAACPNCGAPVDFASAASASAVCGFCRSTLVRDGDALRRIGVSAELFDDHSPLQLGVRGQRQGIAFSLVGRLQYGYAEGSWNEWHALFDIGPNEQRSAWLSEDNGAYVIAFDAPLPPEFAAGAAAIEALRAGGRTVADGRAWDVASVQRAHLIAAEGELPSPPRLQGEFTVVDLRNPAGEVATLDTLDPQRAGWAVGRSVLLSDLALQDLRETGEKTLRARGVECPNCGAPLNVQLSSTKSIACGQCSAVVDVSAGVGADLSHYLQNNAGTSGAQPLLALGSTGTLALDGQPLPWQVVGYQERCTVPAADDEDGEVFYWREYLLYNAQAGFAFIVDSSEGWSWMRPITGAPTQGAGRAQWQGVDYRLREQYLARVSWVQGEFYWRVRRDEQARVADYAGVGNSADARLSREQTPAEVTWSAGRTLAAASVADAFGIAPAQRNQLQRDAAPLAFKGGQASKALVLVIVVIVAIVLLSQCGRDDCGDVRNTFGAASNEYAQCTASRGSGGIRSGGGSFGGWSSGGGGHK